MYINQFFYQSLSFYYKTITKLTVLRCRYEMDTFRIIFEFSHALLHERLPFNDLTDNDFFLLYTAEKEISLYAGQNLHLQCFDGENLVKLFTPLQTTQFIQYSGDPWISSSMIVHISAKSLQIKSSHLIFVYSDVLACHAHITSVAKFVVAI